MDRKREVVRQEESRHQRALRSTVKTEARVRAEQDATPAGQLLLRMGRSYYDTESSARRVAEFAAELLAIPHATQERTDDDLRQFWRASGGTFFGPHVETGDMPEAQLLPLLRRILAERDAAQAAGVNMVRAIWHGTKHTGLDHRDCLEALAKAVGVELP